MSLKIDKDIIELINQKTSLKALATVDRDGVPHVAFKGSLHINDEGLIEYYEILESSKTNSNLVAAIWYGYKVAINILTEDKRSFLIKGVPVRDLTSGKEYEKHYKNVREKFGDVDLGSVWFIEPESIVEETFAVKKAEQEEKYPLINHLDRLVKKEEVR